MNLSPQFARHGKRLSPGSAASQFASASAGRNGRAQRSRRRSNSSPLGLEVLEERLLLSNDPDLVMFDATAPASAILGETIPVSWRVRNQGTDTSADWFD